MNTFKIGNIVKYKKKKNGREYVVSGVIDDYISISTQYTTYRSVQAHKLEKVEQKVDTKFKVDDRVIFIRDCPNCSGYKKGDVVVLATKLNSISKGWWAGKKGMNIQEEDFEPIGETMSKHKELKARIEALENGWDSDADDIREEVKGEHSLVIWEGQSCGGIIQILKNAPINLYWQKTNALVTFDFDPHMRCQKMVAFKKALIWLLDHSDIKNDETQEKIDGFKESIKALEAEVDKLERRR